MRTDEVKPDRAARLGQMATFGAVSVTTTLLDFGLFNAIIYFDVMPLLMANTLSYGAGIVASYVLNKRLTFAGGGRDKQSHEIALFIAFNVGGMWLNNFAVALASSTVGTSALFLNGAKLGAGVATWVVKFLTFRRWVYPVRPEESERDAS